MLRKTGARVDGERKIAFRVTRRYSIVRLARGFDLFFRSLFDAFLAACQGVWATVTLDAVFFGSITTPL